MNWQVIAGDNPVPQAGEETAYHSRYNPQREAERWLEQERVKLRHRPALAVLIGVGFGYQLEIFRRQFPHLPALALEPDADLAHLARQVRGAALDATGIPIFAGAICLTSGLANSIVQRAGGLQGVWILVFPAARRLQGDMVKAILGRLQAGMAQDLTSLCTERHFTLLWLRNALANLPHILASDAALTLRAAPAGLPAVVVGASPHLDDWLAVLREICGRVLLVACDTALTPLTRARVRPHLVVCADPQKANTEHFTGHDPTVPLVYDAAVYPDIWERHHGEKNIVGDVGSPLAGFLARRGGAISDWLAGGSVASIALQVALQAGAREVWFVGVDYAYPAGRVYARGTRSHRLLLQAADRFAPPDTGERQALAMRHAGGEPVSDPLLRQYAGWLNDYLARGKITACRVNADTLLDLPLRDLRDLRSLPEQPVRLPAQPVPWRRDTVRTALGELQAEIAAWQTGDAATWRARAGGDAGVFMTTLLPAEWRACRAGSPLADEVMRAALAEIAPVVQEMLAAAVARLRHPAAADV